jgi:hypothetical protein
MRCCCNKAAQQSKTKRRLVLAADGGAWFCGHGGGLKPIYRPSRLVQERGLGCAAGQDKGGG